jgi:hypothetical protein
MVLKYMREFFIIFFGFLAFISLLFLGMFVIVLPIISTHYLETLGYNAFVTWSAFVLQYMILYIIARSTKFINDEIVNL